ncbi:hypothetical protein RF11_05604 [Thelohanellus kitauei]|uniref:Uncharacterized protein n=1 Tax=Thelohanellus kitauei TaxID=669202 RepID=A0A0C2I5W0_THEKT|nr:hypothetical protein RF11_05602 [Thelohanellus kitauei]KII60530.1 hypothetical protein RF11_05604 [Thelohanellus kitauei]
MFIDRFILIPNYTSCFVWKEPSRGDVPSKTKYAARKFSLPVLNKFIHENHSKYREFGYGDKVWVKLESKNGYYRRTLREKSADLSYIGTLLTNIERDSNETIMMKSMKTIQNLETKVIEKFESMPYTTHMLKLMMSHSFPQQILNQLLIIKYAQFLKSVNR